MNNKTNFLIIILSVFIFITSCKKKEKDCVDVEGDLSTEELSWLSYSGGEVLIFKSNVNLTDTFHVANKDCFYNVGYHESEDPCQHHQQCCSVQALNYHYVFTIGACHYNQWNRDGSVYLGYSQFEPFIFTDYTPQNNILINGHYYNDVYVMSTDTTSANFHAPGIWRVYYTKQNGVLRYDVTQSQFYERIN